MAKAYTFVQALKAAGPNPTRAGLLKAVFNMNDKTNPFLEFGHRRRPSHLLVDRDATGGR